jgi:hypothetical protein
MKKITEGRVRDRGVTWFPQLTDKSKCVCDCLVSFMLQIAGKNIKVHLYWAMKNCEGSPKQLERLIENVPLHYMVSTYVQCILLSFL